MMKWIKTHREVVNALLTIIGLAIVLGGAFFLSQNIGDRTKDKLEPTPTPGDILWLENPLAEANQEYDEEKMKELEEIDYTTFKEYLNDKKKTTVIMLGYDDCYWCKQQKPVLQMLMYEKKSEVKYQDVSKLTIEENNELSSLHKDLEEYGTPTFLAVKNKKVTKVSGGGQKRSQLIETFKDMGILK